MFSLARLSLLHSLRLSLVELEQIDWAIPMLHFQVRGTYSLATEMDQVLEYPVKPFFGCIPRYDDPKSELKQSADLLLEHTQGFLSEPVDPDHRLFVRSVSGGVYITLVAPRHC